MSKELEPRGPFEKIQDAMPEKGDEMIEGLLGAYLGVEVLVEEEEVV